MARALEIKSISQILTESCVSFLFMELRLGSCRFGFASCVNCDRKCEYEEEEESEYVDFWDDMGRCYFDQVRALGEGEVDVGVVAVFSYYAAN